MANGGGNDASGPEGASSRTSRPAPQRAASTASSAASSTMEGSSGRAFTPAQEEIVQQILKSKEGGRGAHYRVLGVNQDAGESDLKKAYRKLALKVRLESMFDVVLLNSIRQPIFSCMISFTRTKIRRPMRTKHSKQ